MSNAAMGKISHALLRGHPIASARILEQGSAADVAAAFESVPGPVIASILSRLEPPKAIRCLALLPSKIGAEILATLSTSAASGMLRLLEPMERERLLGSLSDTVREPITRALAYSPNAAGSIADANVPTLYQDLTVREAIDRLRANKAPIATRIFVLNRSQLLVGSTTARQLLGASLGATVGSLDLGTAPSVHVSELASELTLAPVAVVESDDRFVGVITAKALSRVRRKRRSSSIINPVAALGELYWVGMSEVFGGLSSGLRAGKTPEEASHADS
ncbi:MAG: CBS domain-containing protein [Acidobacteria bacterium]|nr:CBS domain-containing protein [Acidobacteriota bacterium]